MPKFLDLFAGAGGLSEGFIRAGYEPVAHIEMDDAACYTLRTRAAYHWLKKSGQLYIYNQYLNEVITRDEFYSKIPDHVLKSVIQVEISGKTLSFIFDEIDRVLDGESLDLIVGGPPCQAYSVVGRSRDANRMVGDKRNYLYILYQEFLKRYRPKYFVFENVVGLLSAREKDGSLHFENMRKLFQMNGYRTEYRVLNASDFGVLQNRKRVILIGTTEKGEILFPNSDKDWKQYTVEELLKDLKPLHAGEGTVRPTKTRHYKGTYLYEAGIKEYDREPVTFHEARPNTQQDLEIYKIAVSRWNESGTRISYLDLPERLRTHHNTKSFLDRFKVVAKNLPFSQTIVAHIARDGHYYIHPEIKQNRSLTPREAARIQTFPDNYYFESKSGIPSRTQAFKQIGNAVPVCLAYCIAKTLLNCIEERKENE